MIAEDSIKKCIFCKKTLTSNRYLPLCNACRNKGKKIGHGIAGTTALLLTSKMSKKLKK